MRCIGWAKLAKAPRSTTILPLPSATAWAARWRENLPAGSPVEVTYSYDSNGRINCTGMELTSRQVASTEIVRGGLQTTDVDLFETLARDYHVE